MRQVLFRIGIGENWFPDGIPIYGYGMMLFVAFIVCTRLAGRRAQQVGIRKELIQDLALWLFVGGIVGARIAYLIHAPDEWLAKTDEESSLRNFFRELPQIWRGGVVFYGGAIGGVVVYLLAYRFVIRKAGVSTLKLADAVAPSIAIGLCLGRIGCLLNGCCYGQPAPGKWYAGAFPLPAHVRPALVSEGVQTAAGFTLVRDESGVVRVGKVEPGSPAWESGLQEGDLILQVTHELLAGKKRTMNVLSPGSLFEEWPQGENSVQLTVRHKGRIEETTLPSFTPRTIGVHMTQVYESISMALLFFLLMAYTPFRRHDGEVVALLMLGYGIHRTLNEMLRMDKRPGFFEIGVSVFLIVSALGLWIWLRRRPGQYEPGKTG